MFSSLTSTASKEYWRIAIFYLYIELFYLHKSSARRRSVNMSKSSRIRDILNELTQLVGDIGVDGEPTTGQGFSELGDLPHRVIHLKNNPLTNWSRREQQEYENLKRDNERMRARLSLIEEGNNADITMRIDEAVNSTNQISMLTRKVAELKEREDKILNSFKKTSREFREVCYLLTGYRIDPLKDDIVRLSHMYAEHEEDKLFFELKGDGTISLLENDYANQYSEFITTYLEEADSFPAFLSALTLDLFKATSHSVDMTVDMSTTCVPNYTRYTSK